MTETDEKTIEQYASGDAAVFAAVHARFAQFALHEACGKCVPCREGSKRILEILDRIELSGCTAEDAALLEDLADCVIAAALCGLGKAACRVILRAALRFQGKDPTEHPGLREEAHTEHPTIHAEDCKGCGKCRRGCPMGAISGDIRQPHSIDPTLCVNCQACVSNCPFGAVRPADEPKADECGVMYVDGLRVRFEGEKNVLAVVRKAGIEMPTFCFHSELSVYGACRMCIVELENGSIVAACALPPKDGMKVRTNTGRLMRSRRLILELMLSAHCRDCTSCEVSGSCTLQRLAARFGIRAARFADTRIPYQRDLSSEAITLDLNRCILCGDCIRMCREVQGVGVLQFEGKGSELRLAAGKAGRIAQTDCVSCGQCSAACPTGAIIVKNNIGDAWRVLHDPSKRVVVQVAPAVRVAMGEMFNLPAGENSLHRIVAAFKIMGAEAVYDTTFGADLTVMEESEEFLERLETGAALPMFTSCCPAWVRYVENRHPELMPQLSTCKSPMEMLGAVIKEHYADVDAADGRETVHIALMPCTAKKMEAARPEFRTDGKRDVDLVLTTREFGLMIQESGILFSELVGQAPDMPFGLGTGAGVIFGSSGGVAEAVARQLIGVGGMETLVELAVSGLRGTEEFREATVNVAGQEVRVAVVHGLGRVEALIADLKAGRAHYDLVEVMSCRTGCVGGAGQPGARAGGRRERAAGLYSADRDALIKQSEYNPIVQRLYVAGLVDRSEELLHVHYNKKEE